MEQNLLLREPNSGYVLGLIFLLFTSNPSEVWLMPLLFYHATLFHSLAFDFMCFLLSLG